ncbi:hypothetical protein GIB67_014562 [Kingdonia uniflora]|uniref:Beta-fructofuranosidase n=1 Tax=Kingdonia uniflora TaxID=39325 RepID=A0A7J7L737_9MAGN|nr:hypothetical protein GIB67_014562 [Kingdonia uniflora]
MIETGPMYFNGIYHLFYQYNPFGSVWGNIVWAHSVSKDMINWLPLDNAIKPSKPFDKNGCWSGSATILPGNKPVILYTGIDLEHRQVQNIAFPKNLSDPYLTEWERPDYNPIIVPDGINASSFRDPTTAWRGSDGYWRILVGNKRGSRGMALLYKSRDFKKWTKKQHPLHSGARSGMWECPDFFPVSLKGKEGLDTSARGSHVKYILKMSLDLTRFDYYTVGKYNEEKDQYVPDNTSPDNSTGLRYDYGNFYASKTFFDAGKNRRILWGWANESDYKEQENARGWAGIQMIPRSVWLHKNGRQLMQWPIEEVENLRGRQVHLRNVPLKKENVVQVKGVTAAQADVEVTFHIPSLKNAEAFDPTWVDAERLCGKMDSTVQGGIGPFGLLTLGSSNLEEYTAVYFRVFRNKHKPVVLMCNGGPRSSLRTNLYKPSFGGFVDAKLAKGKLSLRTLIDHSVVEGFGAGGKTVVSSRAYPTLAVGKDAHLFAFNNGTTTVIIRRLKAWNMARPLKMN